MTRKLEDEAGKDTRNGEGKKIETEGEKTSRTQNEQAAKTGVQELFSDDQESEILDQLRKADSFDVSDLSTGLDRIHESSWIFVYDDFDPKIMATFDTIRNNEEATVADALSCLNKGLGVVEDLKEQAHELPEDEAYEENYKLGAQERYLNDLRTRLSQYAPDKNMKLRQFREIAAKIGKENSEKQLEKQAQEKKDKQGKKLSDLLRYLDVKKISNLLDNPESTVSSFLSYLQSEIVDKDPDEDPAAYHIIRFMDELPDQPDMPLAEFLNQPHLHAIIEAKTVQIQEKEERNSKETKADVEKAKQLLTTILDVGKTVILKMPLHWNESFNQVYIDPTINDPKSTVGDLGYELSRAQSTLSERTEYLESLRDNDKVLDGLKAEKIRLELSWLKEKKELETQSEGLYDKRSKRRDELYDANMDKSGDSVLKQIETEIEELRSSRDTLADEHRIAIKDLKQKIADRVKEHDETDKRESDLYTTIDELRTILDKHSDRPLAEFLGSSDSV